MPTHVYVVVLLLLGSTVSARPNMEPFLGALETITPASVSDDGRTARQNHTLVSDGVPTMHLSYKVEHPDGVFILKLEQEDSIVGVLCDGGEIELAFRDETAARRVTEQLEHGSLIVGHLHWGCADPTSGVPGIILRKLVTDKFSLATSPDGGATVIIHDTEEASYRHFFKHADILFTTSAFPKDHFKQHTRHSDAAPFKNQAAEPASERDRQLGVTDFVSSAVSTYSSQIKSIASTVATIAQGTLKVSEILVSGEYDVTRQKSFAGFAWNYNATQQTAIETRITLAKGGLDCVNCFARGDLKLVMELKIHSHKLQIAEISTSGTLEINLEGHLHGAANLNSTFEKEVHTITMNTIEISVYGVPIFIDLTVPIHVGYEANIHAQGTLKAHAKGSGQMKYGVRYDSEADKKLELINEHNYGHSGGLDSMHMGASASLMLYALPTFILKVQKIGGPVVGIKPFLEFAVEGSYTSGSGSNGGGSEIRGDGGGSSSVPPWQQQGSSEFCSTFCGAGRPCPPPCVGCPHCPARRLLRSEGGDNDPEGVSMDAVVQASDPRRLYSTCAPNSISGAINWGLHVSIGAQIDIEFVKFHKESPQKGVTAIKKPLQSGCFDIGTGTDKRSGSRRELGPQPSPPRSLGSGEQLGMESWRHRNGQVYFGTLRYTGTGHKCDSTYGVQSVETTGYLSLQLINVVNSGTGDMFDMIGSLNYGHAQQGSAGNYACVFQKKYSYSGYEYQGIASLVPFYKDSTVDYKACTSGFTQSQDGYSCTIGNDHQLSCDDSMKCFHIELSQQGTTTAPAVDLSSPPDSTTMPPASTAMQPASATRSNENSCQYAFDNECDEPDWCAYGTDTNDCAMANAISTMSPAVSTACVDNEDIPASNRWWSCKHTNMHKHSRYCQCDDCYQYDVDQEGCVQCPSGSCFFIDDNRHL